MAFEVIRAKPSKRALAASLQKVITHRMVLSEAQQALQMVAMTVDTPSEARGCVKAMLYADGKPDPSQHGAAPIESHDVRRARSLAATLD